MNPNLPLVSIVVPVYRAERFLRPLCESILQQTYSHFEVFFLDDGSGDGGVQVLKSFCDPRFQVFQWQKNRGVNSATLALLNRVSGMYWCNPGADDVLKSDFLEQRVELMEKNPQAAMIHGPGVFIDENGNEIPSPYPSLPAFPETMTGESGLRMILQHNVVNTPSILVRTDLTRLVLPHFSANWQYAQDWYLWILLLGLGFDLLWDTNPLHYYRIHSGSLTYSPEKTAVRQAEIRLVPLVGLSRAASFSETALQCWNQWGEDLYALWLIRALRLKNAGRLRKEWVLQGLSAFRGMNSRSGIFSETMRFAPRILRTFLREKSFRQKQSFPVSGLAQINHPIFSDEDRVSNLR
jgi:glycosyltransferase involved in cell wall biosynthesis